MSLSKYQNYLTVRITGDPERLMGSTMKTTSSSGATARDVSPAKVTLCHVHVWAFSFVVG